MTNFYKIVSGAALAALAAADAVPLIIDTDMGFDVDDVGAVCMANELMILGEANILAIVHDTGYKIGIGGVSSINHYYGHDSIPLGAYKGEFGRADDGTGSQNNYLSDIIRRFPGPVTDYDGVPTAVETYRKALVAADDKSVHIASLGMTTNLRDLLQSQGDSISSLTGVQLVEQKVKKVVWMDMMYNFGCAEHDTSDWLGDDAGCRGSA